MDINQLEVFLAVAQEKSFSRAAETLHRTQPAASKLSPRRQRPPVVSANGESSGLSE